MWKWTTELGEGVMERISVLIVDDHAVVRRGLRAFLESEGDIEVIAEAVDGAEAIQKVQEWLPNVVLMDLVMPGLDGIAAIREIGRISPNSHVLVLTSFGEKDKVFAAIRAGAMGYFLKDTRAEDLGRAIRSVARGELLLDAEIAIKVLDEFATIRTEAPALANLTPREVEVLTLIARGRTNKEIANELSISLKTVKTHVSNILSKLHMVDRTQAALYAMRQGLVPGDPGNP
jgi:NarL family two-component system response regulator LiaR